MAVIAQDEIPNLKNHLPGNSIWILSWNPGIWGHGEPVALQKICGRGFQLGFDMYSMKREI